MIKTIQVRIPMTLHREINKVKKEMERETIIRFGRKKPVTFPKAAAEYQRRRTSSFFGGKLL